MAPSILVICGQTATGKTGTALRLAGELGGEIISTDSRQAYVDLDIGTGKDIPPGTPYVQLAEIDGYRWGYYLLQKTKIWLYDVALPHQPIHVGAMHMLAQKTIAQCHTSGTLPILVGGNGFYLKNILTPAATISIPPNLSLRAHLERLSLEALQQQLRTLDPAKWLVMNHSDRHNPRRLIRAIEVATVGHQSETPSAGQEAIWVGLNASAKTISERVKIRVSERLNQGFEGEIRQLLAAYPDFFRLPAAKTLGYQQWHGVIEGGVSKQEAIEAWILAEIQYSKRQKTWFQKQTGIRWFDIEANSWYAQAKSYVTSRITYGQ